MVVMEKTTVGTYEFSETMANELGRGSFSRVYKAHRGGGVGAPAAVKVLDMPPQADGKTKHLLREIELMRHLKHENIVRMIDVQYEKYSAGGLRVFIVMEFCGKGDMSSLPKPLAEDQCQHYFQGIFRGLRYLKRRQIIHRDIKPQNILITGDDQVKIADFTFSRQIQENQLLETQCGTPMYISPDVMFGRPYNEKSDLYSCGVMLYTFMYGTHPLGKVRSHGELMQKMRTVTVQFPRKLIHEFTDPADGKFSRVIREFSPALLDLVEGLLKMDADRRWGWDRIETDPWISLDPMETAELFPVIDDCATSGDCTPTDQVVHAFSAPLGTSPLSGGLIPRSVVRPPPPPPRGQHSTTRAPWAPLAPSGQTQWDMSSSSAEDHQSRLILDYSSAASSPSGISPRQQPTMEETMRRHSSRSLLSRSIETIQRVFSLKE